MIEGDISIMTTTTSLSYTLFTSIVIRNKVISKSIFNFIGIVNRIINDPPLKCSCTERGGCYGDTISPVFLDNYGTLDLFIECDGDKRYTHDYGCVKGSITEIYLPFPNQNLRYCLFTSMTLEWCCRFGTPSLLYDLLSRMISQFKEDVESSTPSKIKDYIKENIFTIEYIVKMLMYSLKCGNLEVFKYLLQIGVKLYTNQDKKSNTWLLKYQQNLSATQYKDIILQLDRTKKVDEPSILKLIPFGISMSMKYGYVELLQLLLGIDAAKGEIIERLEYFKILTKVYSGGRLDCLERDQSIQCSWKTKSEIEVIVAINQSFKIQHKVLSDQKEGVSFDQEGRLVKKQKMVVEQQFQVKYQTKVFPPGTSRFYLVMLIMVEYIKSMFKDQEEVIMYYDQSYDYPIAHLENAPVFSSPILAPLYRDYQGIQYLLELGIQIDTAWDLETIKLVERFNKEISHQSSLFEISNTPIDTYKYIMDRNGGIEYLAGQLINNLLQRYSSFMINSNDPNILPLMKQIIDKIPVTGVKKICIPKLAMNCIEICIKLNQLEWLKTFISIMNISNVDTTQLELHEKRCLFYALSVGSHEILTMTCQYLRYTLNVVPKLFQDLKSLDSYIPSENFAYFYRQLIDNNMMLKGSKEQDRNIDQIYQFIIMQQQQEPNQFLSAIHNLERLQSLYNDLKEDIKVNMFRNQFYIYIYFNLLYHGLLTNLPKDKMITNMLEPLTSKSIDIILARVAIWASHNERLDILEDITDNHSDIWNRFEVLNPCLGGLMNNREMFMYLYEKGNVQNYLKGRGSLRWIKLIQSLILNGNRDLYDKIDGFNGPIVADLELLKHLQSIYDNLESKPREYFGYSIDQTIECFTINIYTFNYIEYCKQTNKNQGNKNQGGKKKK